MRPDVEVVRAVAIAPAKAADNGRLFEHNHLEPFLRERISHGQPGHARSDHNGRHRGFSFLPQTAYTKARIAAKFNCDVAP